MSFTIGGLPAEDIRTIRTENLSYDNVHNVREVVDRGMNFVAFEWNQTVIIGDKGRCAQEVTVRVLLSHVMSVESPQGEPQQINEPF